MSRTYKVRRNSGGLQGVKKEWVLFNERGAKKYQRMVNKRCRRLDKIAIAEGINEIIDDAEEVVAFLEELFDDQYEEDYYDDYYENEPEDDYYENEPEDDYYEEDFWNYRDDYYEEDYYLWSV